MTAPNMAAITASLERSLQNCSLNHHHHHHHQSSSTSSTGSSSGSPPPPDSYDATLELNSQISLPYQWEQCLDLKTGEVYYINWRTGMKAKEDPRISNEFSGEVYSSDDDSSSYDEDESDEGSSTESSPSTTSKFHHNHVQVQVQDERKKEQTGGGGGGGVLVVAGCKSCLMYFMVPKQVGDCPKCAGQLLHFDRSDDTASP